jgi:hypothetical protein
MVQPMKYRDLLTAFLLVGFLLSLAYAFGVSQTVWFWIVPILFFVALLWAVYYLWLT